jgi:multisubunit Na+/H+ antiporter MnhB subunit
VLGIISLVCCGVIGVIVGAVNWFLASSALKEINAAPGTYGGRGMVKAGLILSIIGVVLGIIGTLVWIGLLASGDFSGGFSTSP